LAGLGGGGCSTGTKGYEGTRGPTNQPYLGPVSAAYAPYARVDSSIRGPRSFIFQTPLRTAKTHGKMVASARSLARSLSQSLSFAPIHAHSDYLPTRDGRRSSASAEPKIETNCGLGCVENGGGGAGIPHKGSLIGLIGGNG
jgi:hypothetical protein